MEKKKEDLKVMADALEELQLSLEPVRDKALDQKAFYTGYAQCAEQMIKVIVAKMTSLRNQAEQEEEIKEEIKEETKEEIESEAPLIIDETPKKKRKKKEE